MKRPIHYFLTLFILLNSCADNRKGPTTVVLQRNMVVLERNSAAVGDGGALIENVGLETIGGVFTPLLETGCATPCTHSEIFSTAQDNQDRFQVSLFRGKEELVSNNHSLGVCYVVDIPRAPRGIPKIEVTVEAADKEIRIFALDAVTKKTLAIQCNAKPAG
jgi:molecular chaperone DnaK (HSP70)